MFKRDGRIANHIKAAVAARGFAFAPRERVLFFRARMQKHREILADRNETARKHLFYARADNHPIAIAHRQPEQAIAHRPADQINFQIGGWVFNLRGHLRCHSGVIDGCAAGNLTAQCILTHYKLL